MIKLINEIKKLPNGISLDKFIEICLFNEEGYYNNANPIGKNGDFITAPEVSQLFGEILGLYIYNIWEKNFGKKINLIELGPGKGTLISDILRITKSFASFNDKINIKLIEINDHLKKLQIKSIMNSHFDIRNVQWHNNFEMINPIPSIIYGNEFFDCLPIKQYIKINKSWNEKKIFFSQKNNKLLIKNSIIRNINIINNLNLYAKKYGYKNEQIIEISNARKKYYDKLCKFIKKNSGIIIIFDYGYENSIHYSTLQSIKNHKHTHILDDPGKQDITSLVNFRQLKEIAIKNNLYISNYSSQKKFLISNGIIERKNKILLNCSIQQKQDIEKGFKRLTSNDKMGKLFKCLIVSSNKFDE